MNNNMMTKKTKNKLTFAASMSNHHHPTTSSINSNNPKTTTTTASSRLLLHNNNTTTYNESGGALFRSVSMDVVVEPSLHHHHHQHHFAHDHSTTTTTIPFRGTIRLSKSHSTPIPSSDLPKSGTASTSTSCTSTATSSTTSSDEQEPWVWKLLPHQVRPVPIYHPLEHTAITVYEDDVLPLDEITRRISTFLKQESIPAKYDDDRGRVSCMTEGLVKFVVQLWRKTPITTTTTTTNTGSNGVSGGGGIVVEVQRRQGCCIAMQAIRHHLLDAILMGTGQPYYYERHYCQHPHHRALVGSTTTATATMITNSPSSKTTSTSTTTCCPRTTCGILQNLVERTARSLPPPPPNHHLPCGSAALDLAKRLLKSDRLDAQRLALESLCSLTNPAQVFLRDADQISRIILLGVGGGSDDHDDASDDDNDHSEWQELLGRYFEKYHISSAHMHDDDGNDNDNNNNNNNNNNHGGGNASSMNLDYQQGELMGELHFLALKVVSQAIESLVVAPPGAGAANHKNQFSFSTPFWTTVLQALYYNVTVATHRPLEAAWSIRSLRHLQSVQPDDFLLQFFLIILEIPKSSQQQHAAGRLLYESLVKAHDFGRQQNRSLQVETEQWMGRLDWDLLTSSS